MEVTDAYQDYVKTRRERVPSAKICTLTLSESEMGSIGYLISDALADHGDDISDSAKKKWLSILRSVQTSIERGT